MARSSNRYNALGTVNSVKHTDDNRIYQVALYARLSVDRMNRKSESIESQLSIMKKYVKGHPEFANVTEFIDRGFSGTNFHRPAFEEMMEKVRQSRIDCIIVKDLSRLGRDYLETSNLIEMIFPFLGVRFISVNDHFDTCKENNGNKSMEIALKNLVNDMYARDISKRLTVARKQEQQIGKFVGSNAPYGYKVNEADPLRHFLIDEEAAQVVRDIYSMVLDGKNLQTIAYELQERGLHNPGQYLRTGELYVRDGEERQPWYKGTVSNILHNKAYIGHLIQGKRKTRLFKGEKQHFTEEEEWIITENTHEPILSEEVFETVQQKLCKNYKDSTFSSKQQENLPIKPNKYAKLLYCGECGMPLSYASEVRSGERRYFFNCAGSYDHKKKEKCRVRITEKCLEEILRELFGSILREYEAKGNGLQQLFDQEEKKVFQVQEREIKKMEQRIAKSETVMAELYEDYVLGNISKELFLEQKKTVGVTSEDDRKKLQELRDKKNAFQQRNAEKLKWLLAMEAVAEMELDKELIQFLVKRIEVYPGHQLKVFYPFEEHELKEE